MLITIGAERVKICLNFVITLLFFSYLFCSSYSVVTQLIEVEVLRGDTNIATKEVVFL